jgi:hypothetical protein
VTVGGKLTNAARLINNWPHSLSQVRMQKSSQQLQQIVVAMSAVPLTRGEIMMK